MVRERLSKNVVRVTIPLKRNKQWEYWLLCTSDEHFDSIKCDRTLLKKHFEEAQKRGAGIINYGDFFDLMQGKLDPRQSKDELRPEYLERNYLDAVLNDAMIFLEPYADQIVLLSNGNHETGVRKKYEVDPTAMLIRDLSRKTKQPIFHGHYAGWVTLLFADTKSKRSRHHRAVNIHYHHGSGFKSKVSHVRRGRVLPDANIILYGHHHEWWLEYVPRYRLSARGNITKDAQLHLATPGYKDDQGPGAEGFPIEKGGNMFMPNARGAWWIRFYWDPSLERVGYEPIMAT